MTVFNQYYDLVVIMLLLVLFFSGKEKKRAEKDFLSHITN
jgi:hypothetical protein